MTVTVDGLNRLVRALRAAGDGIDDLKAAHQQVGAMVAAGAAARAPRRSGKLASSVKAAKQANRVRIMVPARVRYAGVIHYGWPKRGIVARPFILDAAEQLETEWIGVYTAAVQAVLDKVGDAS